MKQLILILALTCTSCTYNDMERIFKDRPDSYPNMFGGLDYSKSQNKASTSQNYIHTKKALHETLDRKLLIYTGGSVYRNLDSFKTAYHDNGFAQIGLEY